MSRLPSPRLGRVDELPTVTQVRKLADLGIGVDGWEVRLECEYLPGPLVALAVTANPEAKPGCDYLLMLWEVCPVCDAQRETCPACDDTGGKKRAFASVSLAGELVPVTRTRAGRPVHRFARRVWQRARHAVEQAREAHRGAAQGRSDH